jgi:hypothetical protein
METGEHNKYFKIDWDLLAPFSPDEIAWHETMYMIRYCHDIVTSINRFYKLKSIIIYSRKKTSR